MSLVSRHPRIVAGVGAVLLTGSLAGAGSAQAAPQDPSTISDSKAPTAAPGKPYVTVTASRLYRRMYPSTDSTRKGGYNRGAKVGVDCKVNAQNVQGNTIWYKIRGEERWLSARWAKNTGSVRLCKQVFRSAESPVPGAVG
ncbi:hypothetical protein [Streptomyces xiaopingdaonensis]|uniref:hypothetical protein n=1 Tax=Streptomyces xiaopingdaonensis TaxID=1565415 RepID=UPI0002E35D0D|nr:hypothetical protein [Streptomyces xiaopingdaonensis]